MAVLYQLNNEELIAPSEIKKILKEKIKKKGRENANAKWIPGPLPGFTRMVVNHPGSFTVPVNP